MALSALCLPAHVGLMCRRGRLSRVPRVATGMAGRQAALAITQRGFAEGTENIYSRFLRWVSGANDDEGKFDKDHLDKMSQTTDFFNCGCTLGKAIPQPELVLYQEWKIGSQEWAIQLYGAALYWHMVSTEGSVFGEADPHILQGLDVLEVGCTRGGGARYLAEVMSPRSYVATDVSQDHIDACIESTRSLSPPALSFERVDGMALDERFPPESFDVVLCVQGFCAMGQSRRFIEGAAHVLRPGGRLLFCDALTEVERRMVLADCEDVGLSVGAAEDITKKVEQVGICRVHRTKEFWRIPARKGAIAKAEAPK